MGIPVKLHQFWLIQKHLSIEMEFLELMKFACQNQVNSFRFNTSLYSAAKGYGEVTIKLKKKDKMYNFC